MTDSSEKFDFFFFPCSPAGTLSTLSLLGSTKKWGLHTTTRQYWVKSVGVAIG